MRGKPLFYRHGEPIGGLIPACAGKTSLSFVCFELSRAHPRVCGENLIPRAMTLPKTGSSPRVRGKRPPARRVHARPGLIPACAGKTLGCERRSRHSRAHPRVCGENSKSSEQDWKYSGSSPRVRGKQTHEEAEDLESGLIPACAGKTLAAGGGRISPGAHPRVCGENAFLMRPATKPGGSSPRVRGKHRSKERRSPPAGLIPACAGKTFPQRAEARSQWAHPRVCGENERVCGIHRRAEGSSPRVRGKRRTARISAYRRGLIPACAGKTVASARICSVKGAHPRVCGENEHFIRQKTVQLGSSPRVRGKPQKASPAVDTAGLIPACAGKTQDRYSLCSRQQAHPRVCGENSISLMLSTVLWISSPRVRGKL